MLKEYYKKYLKDIRGLSDRTVGHYITSLNVISKMLKEKNIIEDSIFEVTSINQLSDIKEIVFNDKCFIEKDSVGHNMYSAGFNNYFRFANGKEYTNLRERIDTLDMKLPKGYKNISSKQVIRDKIIVRQVIESNDYKCEVNSSHETFIAEVSQRPYMEGHHIIALENQNLFEYSLDVYANMLGICPICHRMLHYGIQYDKERVLKIVYCHRKDRLFKSGIVLSLDELLRIAAN